MGINRAFDIRFLSRITSPKRPLLIIFKLHRPFIRLLLRDILEVPNGFVMCVRSEPVPSLVLWTVHCQSPINANVDNLVFCFKFLSASRKIDIWEYLNCFLKCIAKTFRNSTQFRISLVKESCQILVRGFIQQMIGFVYILIILQVVIPGAELLITIDILIDF
jgi:hypothetical protein